MNRIYELSKPLVDVCCGAEIGWGCAHLYIIDQLHEQGATFSNIKRQEANRWFIKGMLVAATIPVLYRVIPGRVFPFISREWQALKNGGGC